MEDSRVTFTDYQRAELENSFKKFFPNADGKISINSVNNLCRSLEGIKHPNISKSIIRGPLNFPNGEHECDFEYFIKLIEETLTDPAKFEKALEQTFRMMDVQFKGAINSEDLISISEVLNENISSDDEAIRILQRAESAPGEPKISKESLKNFLKNDLDRNYIP